MLPVSTLRRHTRKQASIVVTVMLIMVISSFLVLLTMRYFLSMLHGFTSLTNYDKAYYMARGGMDVLKTQHAYRGWGYETQLLAGGASGDFACGSACDMRGGIASRFPRVDASPRPDSATCDQSTAISLASGQSIIFALFADQHGPTLDFVQIDSGAANGYAGFLGASHVLNTLDLMVYSTGGVAALTGQVYVYDATQGDFGTTELLTGGVGFPTNIIAGLGGYVGVQPTFLGSRLSAPGKYVIIKNTSPAPYALCISSPNKNIIGPTSIIHVDGRMQDTFVSLEAVKTNRFPSILLQ